jgi:hypothetical protein
MRKGILLAWTCGALLVAGVASGHDEGRSPRAGETDNRAAPGVIERGLARLERAIARLEARLSGRGASMMEGCSDMMAGGGMMGGSRPNERWRSSPGR